MATYSLTPNLGLRVELDISVNDKYNLNRIDELAGRISIGSTGITSLSANSDIYITAKSGRGITNVDGNIFLRSGNLLSGDTLSSVTAYARSFNFIGKTDNPDESSPSSILFKVDSIDFNGASVLNFTPNLPIANSTTTGLLSSADWNRFDSAVSLKHSHSNISVLNATEEAFTSELKAQYDAAVASGGFISVQKVLTSDDITNGFVVLPSEPAVPSDTLCMPQEAPSQFYGENLDYTVSSNKLYFGVSNIQSMGTALEEGDHLTILYR